MNVSFNKEIVGTPRIKSNRDYLLNKNQNFELNTYATWGEVTPKYDNENNNGNAGVRSIFNKYTVVLKDGNNRTRIGDNVPLIDTPDIRKLIKKNSDCSVKNLVTQSKLGVLGAETYDYSDFAYCKHLGKMPNNYMITLRRFPIAIGDYINSPGLNKNNEYPNSGFGDQTKESSYTPPASIGCMVTWVGTPGNDIENILKYDYSMPFQSKKAELQTDQKGDQPSFLNSIFSAFDKKYQEQVMEGKAGNALEKFPGGLFKNAGNAPYADHLNQVDQNKVYGPIDRIMDTHIRSDEGLQFNHSFSLQFEYELRSYSNINTRQAMLDLLANILAVTYTSGDFYGGGYRSTGAHQSDLFTNMKVFQAKGGVTNTVDSFHDDLKDIWGNVKKGIEANGGFVETIKDAVNSFGGMILGGLLNKWGRPQKNFLNSILSPAPVGYWHVTVGNPFHPIMSIGNMILEKTTITHTGPLGLDDFPTGLKITCDLKRGKGRDKRDIEKLYMHGINRIYTHMGSEIEALYKAAPEYKSTNKVKSSVQVDPETISNNTKDIDNIDNLIKAKDNMVRYFGTGFKDAINLASGEISYGSQSKKGSEHEKEMSTGQQRNNK